MGNTQTQKLKKYWNDSKKKVPLSISQDNRFVQQCFGYYDTKSSGALNKEDAFRYINDLLTISGLKKKILQEANSIPTNPEEYYNSYVENIFREMDVDKDGRISLAELLKPKSSVWDDFLRFVSVQTLHQHTKSKQAAKNESKEVKNIEKKEPKKISEKNSEKSSEKSSDKKELENKQEKKEIIEDEKVEQKKKVKTTDVNDDDEDDVLSISMGDDDSSQITLFSLLTQDRTDDTKSNNNTDNDNDNKDSNNDTDNKSVLSTSGIIKVRTQVVSEVSDIIGIENHVAANLLNFYNWDAQHFLASYFDDPEKTCKIAGIDLSMLTPRTTPTKQVENDTNDTITCTVCFDDTSSYTVLPSCGHFFCNDCWAQNLNFQISNGKSLEIICMKQGCPALVPDHVIKSLVDPALYSKYVQFTSKKFVENNKQIRWCPEPGCSKAITDCKYEAQILVGKCECSHVFCWNCLLPAHYFCDCKQMEKLADSQAVQNQQWLKENTKKCPKCKLAIEKNDGCFQMSCHNCHSCFCWFCLEDWSTHLDHFRCEKYGVGEESLSNTPVHHGEEDGDYVLLSFVKRMFEYGQSKKLAESKRLEMESQLEKLRGVFGIPNLKLIKLAMRTIDRCRTFVQCMCVAQALEPSKKTAVKIAAQQETLETMTERLAQVVERKFPDYTEKDFLEVKKIMKVAIQFLLSLEEQMEW